MLFYLDRFLQHRHSAQRLRLSDPVVCFPSFLSALSLLQSPGGAAAEDLNTPTVTSRILPKNAEEHRGPGGTERLCPGEAEAVAGEKLP